MKQKADLTQPIRAVMDKDLAEVYASKHWTDAQDAVTAAHHALSRAERSSLSEEAKTAVLTDLNQKYTDAIDTRDGLIRAVHEKYHRDCEAVR